MPPLVVSAGAGVAGLGALLAVAVGPAMMIAPLGALAAAGACGVQDGGGGVPAGGRDPAGQDADAFTATLPAPKNTATGLKPNARRLMQVVETVWPYWAGDGVIGGVRQDSLPDHPSGRALDIMMPDGGHSESSVKLGGQVAHWLQANARQLGVEYVIWHQRIWNIARDGEGWRLMSDRGNWTANHMDHVHVTVFPDTRPTGKLTPVGGAGTTTVAVAVPRGMAATVAVPRGMAAPIARKPKPTPSPSTPPGGRSHLATFGDWSQAFLTVLGVPVSEDNVLAVTGWAAAEGFADGHAGGKYNPLNTTYIMPGAGNYNSVGVKNYVSWQQGLDASVKTIQIKGVGYERIIDALRANRGAETVFNAIVSSQWGTKSFSSPSSYRSWLTRPLPFGGGDVNVTVGSITGSTGGCEGGTPAGSGDWQPFLNWFLTHLGSSTNIDGQSVYNYCLGNVQDAWDALGPGPKSNRAPSAYAQALRVRAAGHMHDGYDAPAGGIYWWDSGVGSNAGHVAVADGKGNAVNNWGGSVIEANPVRGMSAGSYMGWSEPTALAD